MAIMKESCSLKYRRKAGENGGIGCISNENNKRRNETETEMTADEMTAAGWRNVMKRGEISFMKSVA